MNTRTLNDPNWQEAINYEQGTDKKLNSRQLITNPRGNRMIAGSAL